MKIVKQGTANWIGHYRCRRCQSVFALELEDGGQVQRVIRDFFAGGVVASVALVSPCPVCGQRKDREFDRVEDRTP